MHDVTNHKNKTKVVGAFNFLYLFVFRNGGHKSGGYETWQDQVLIGKNNKQKNKNRILGQMVRVMDVLVNINTTNSVQKQQGRRQAKNVPYHHKLQFALMSINSAA